MNELNYEDKLEKTPNTHQLNTKCHNYISLREERGLSIKPKDAYSVESNIYYILIHILIFIADS